MTRPFSVLTASLTLGCLIGLGTAVAPPPASAAPSNDTDSSASPPKPADAHELVDASSRVVPEMTSDKALGAALKKAKGVVILPKVVKSGGAAGGASGAGVLLAHRNGKWVGPAFVKVASGQMNPEASGDVHAVVLLLMSDKALQDMSGKHFTLNGNAGLDIVTWSQAKRERASRADVIAWSSRADFFKTLDVGSAAVAALADYDQGFYGKAVSTQDILKGTTSSSKATELTSKLPG